jgi:hypothetical protein
MKINIEFDFDNVEDISDHKLFMKAKDLAGLVWNLECFVYNKWNKKNYIEECDVAKKYKELCNEYDININMLYN